MPHLAPVPLSEVQDEDIRQRFEQRFSATAMARRYLDLYGRVSARPWADVDVAAESTQLARWNILVQSGTAMLSQANQSSQIALKLLG